MSQVSMPPIDFPFPTQLENDRALLLPLEEADFDVLYTVAADPKIWEQHPQPDRWKEIIFRVFFDGAIRSGQTFKIIDKATRAVVGSTRFYEYDAQGQRIFVGYTFFTVRCWGTGLNTAVKKLLLDYAFQYVNTVYFHVGATNIRSQKAVEKLGAQKIAETPANDEGGVQKWNFVYEIRKNNWV